MTNWELYFHGAEVIILLFGCAVPMVYSAIRFRVLFREYPPHRHTNGDIIYPAEYEPGRIQHHHE